MGESGGDSENAITDMRWILAVDTNNPPIVPQVFIVQCTELGSLNNMWGRQTILTLSFWQWGDWTYQVIHSGSWYKHPLNCLFCLNYKVYGALGIAQYGGWTLSSRKFEYNLEQTVQTYIYPIPNWSASVVPISLIAHTHK